MSLDVDGDGVPDAFVPGLTAPVESGGSAVGADRWEAVVSADMPPDTHPMSPMGQIEHVGYALRSRTARHGWRRRLIVTVGWVWVAAVVGTMVLGLLNAAGVL